MKCPVCKIESEGRFCAECGSPLGDARCRSCDAPLVPGARFCTNCGEAVHAKTSGLPWIVAGAAIGALIVVLVLPVLRGGGTGPAGMTGPLDFSGGNAPAGASAQMPPARGGTPSDGAAPTLSADPRENADRLFNRIMTERNNGNLEQARFFLPMALQAYQMAEPLDDDGLFHLALLQSAAGDFTAARTTAERILANNADHLLALAAAGEAMAAAGDTAAARDYYRRFLAVYEAESQKVYPEYIDHSAVMPEYRRAAEALVGG